MQKEIKINDENNELENSRIGKFNFYKNLMKRQKFDKCNYEERKKI